jgi:very-short-patch-repair endonuclease
LRATSLDWSVRRDEVARRCGAPNGVLTWAGFRLARHFTTLWGVVRSAVTSGGVSWPVPTDGAGAFAASHHAVLTRRQAADLEVSPSYLDRLRAQGMVTEPTRGVLVATWSPPTWGQRLYVATRASGGEVTVSHRSAAALHRVDGFEPDQVEVTVRKGRRLRLDDVVVHQTTRPWSEDDRIVIDSIVCTSMARTLVDLPNVASDVEMRRAIDDFERRGLSLRWLESTARRLHRPGQRGSGLVLREIDQRRREGRVPDSWFERLVEACLVPSRFPPITRQHPVFDDAGVLIARLDLAIPVVRVGIEAHSRRFHTGEHRERMDERRDTRLAAAGWEVQYVGWSDVARPERVARSIELVVERRAADLGVDLSRFLHRQPA